MNFPIIHLKSVAYANHWTSIYGAHHLTNSDDSMFVDIEDHISRLQPDLIVVEGNQNLYPSAPAEKYAFFLRQFQILERDAIIEHAGESGFGVWLAKRYNAAALSVGSSVSQEFAAAKQAGLNLTHLLLYYLFRRLDGFARKDRSIVSRMQLEEQISKGYKEYDSENKSMEWFYTESLKILPNLCWDNLHYNVINQIISPEMTEKDIWYSPITLVSQFYLNFNDSVVSDSLANFQKRNRGIFVIYGEGHLKSITQNMVQSGQFVVSTEI